MRELLTVGALVVLALPAAGADNGRQQNPYARLFVAQSLGTVAGTVRDVSGARLPGVTVEMSNPALIEKTRTAVTNGTGQYTVVNLPVGTYTVTFSLAGFNTLHHEGIEVTTDATTSQRRAESLVGLRGGHGPAAGAAGELSTVADRRLRDDCAAGRCENRSEDAAASAGERTKADHRGRSSPCLPEVGLTDVASAFRRTQ